MPTTVGQRLPPISLTILDGESASEAFEIPDGLWEISVFIPNTVTGDGGTITFLTLEGSIDGENFFAIKQGEVIAAFIVNAGVNTVSSYNTTLTPAGVTQYARLRSVDVDGLAVNADGDIPLKVYLSK